MESQTQLASTFVLVLRVVVVVCLFVCLFGCVVVVVVVVGIVFPFDFKCNGEAAVRNRNTKT